MIFYLATRRHRYTIEDYRRTRGRAIASRITPLAYEQVLRARRAHAGTWIFTDLERLSLGAAEDAARLWRDLEESGAPVRLLNHPTRSMRRYELLRHLHERGSNDFDVYRLTEARAPRRYPVFVRGENDHAGSRTPLLHDPEELAAAVEDLERRGYSRQRLLVTEFCDTADTVGVVRKYAAFCVGGRILPRHVFAAKRWVVKGPEVVDEDAAEVERVYVETNPHESALREIFSLAGIDYGRIDYGMRGGRIQVWEINTNPYVTTDGDVGGPLRDWLGPRFAESLRAAWEAIDLEPQARAPIRLHPASRPGRTRALAARVRAWVRNES